MEKGDTGVYAGQMKAWLKDIMFGNEQHPWGVVVNEKGTSA